MIKRRLIGSALGALVAIQPLRTALADTFPSRPIRIIVPFAPGGASDIVARLIGARMQAVLHQPIIVENRPGGGTILAGQLVARAPADGYTLLLAVGTFEVMPSTGRAATAGFDVRTSFDPVAHMGLIPSIVIINPDATPVRSLPELIAYARANPGKLSFASNGVGTTTQLQAELLKIMAGIDMVHISYQGSGPQTVAILRGEVPVSVDGVGPTMPHLRSGKLIALGITSAQRSAQLPDVPAIAEVVPGYEADSTMRLLAPAGTPHAVLETLNAAVRQAFADEEILVRYRDLGVVPITMSVDELRADIARNVDRWARVIRDANLQLD